MVRLKLIDTDKFSEALRHRSVRVDERKLLITNFHGSEQESDLTLPPNCRGFGRLRHFRLKTSEGWPLNPLPIVPAKKALGLQPTDELQAQVFQNAACNWRCWYCFVDFELLSADKKRAEFLSTDELVALYKSEPLQAAVIDLTGGQPDLVPEWVAWMMDSLEAAGLAESTFLWSDDNLSTDLFWQVLSPEQIERVAGYSNYGKVGCFKGFDADSFSFNTLAAPDRYATQFDLMRRLIATKIDTYGYVTLTAPDSARIATRMSKFVDDLQRVHPNLPLRTVPLRIHPFTPVRSRGTGEIPQALEAQEAAIACWNEELQRRYSAAELAQEITNVPLQ